MSFCPFVVCNIDVLRADSHAPNPIISKLLLASRASIFHKIQNKNQSAEMTGYGNGNIQWTNGTKCMMT